ncbi:MAG: glycosyltransferase family 2 protein [Anaerolineales bacterium]|nr:glycosyltransferase family 2 protein [Anaerolineales bacterium]
MSSVMHVAIVIPIYNEAGVVEQSHAHICAVVDELPYQFTFYYVDDGSNDGAEKSLNILATKDSRVKVITLSRNFGHQAALSAGLDHADGDVVISMDGDGQHPPEMISQMLNLIEQGYDIVQTQRMDEAQPASFKKWTSGLFYRLINLISGTRIIPGTADFRALTRRAVDAIKSMPEYHRFLRGMVAWIGFPMVILPYQPVERISGQSKYSYRKMFDLAMNAIFSFSLVPLYIGLSMGGIFLFLAVLEMIYVLSFWVTGRTSHLEPGWSSLMFVLLIIGGVLMILLGFIGVYVGFIFQEAKRRPVYLIKGEKQNGQ